MPKYCQTNCLTRNRGIDYNPLIITSKTAVVREPVIQVKKTLCKPLFLSLAAIFALVIFSFNVLPKFFKTAALQQIIEDGELVVLTRNSPTTYYLGPDGPTGLEYDMVKMFADELGVKLRVIPTDTLTQLLAGIENRVAHFAAAGLTITEDRKEFFRFTSSYMDITEQLIYNISNKRPRSVRDLIGGNLEVVANSSHVDTLVKLKETYPELNWNESQLESDELLKLVADEVIDYTIADSNEFLLSKRHILNLRSAFDISQPRQLAWAFPQGEDASLLDAASAFIEKIRNNGEFDRLYEKNYGHADNLGYVGTTVFRRHVNQRLPQYRDMFIKAAKQHGLDWHLVAAIGYQESHWNPKAVSPTGVRGIMMLTRKTAGDMGVKNRLDPEASINGGAKYFASIESRIPADIRKPDRTWMALAAYNVGLGHLEDARILAQNAGKDPNKWLDVKQFLPKLEERKWYKQTRYGYARGSEPVRYVENIRSYYDLLRWLDDVSTPQPQEPDAFSILPQVP